MTNLRTALSVLACSAAFITSSQAQIVWDPSSVSAITGPSDISALGTSLDALTPHSITLFGGANSGSGSLTVQDTTFNIGTSDSYIAVSNIFDGGDGQAPDGLNAYQQPSQQPTPPSDTNSYNYDELMTHCAATGGSSTVNFSNLTSGQQYQVQIWNSTGRQTTYTSGASSVILTGRDYALGSFVANGTTAAFTFAASGGNDYGVVGDIAIRAVPEPSTYAALALGLCVLVGVTHLRRLAA